MKLTSIFLTVPVLLHYGRGLEEAADQASQDAQDDSVAWQWNLKNRIDSIITDITTKGYIGSTSDQTAFISSSKLSKYIKNLADYADFKLKIPFSTWFDYCGGGESLSSISFSDYKACRMRLQNNLVLYNGISPLISDAQIDLLKTFKIRSQYQSTLNLDEFKQLESLHYVIFGSAIFQLSDSNADGKVEVFEGYNQAEGYQMLNEMARLFNMDLVDVKKLLMSCTGSGNVIKLMLTQTKIEQINWQNLIASGPSNTAFHPPAPALPQAQQRRPTSYQQNYNQQNYNQQNYNQQSYNQQNYNQQNYNQNYNYNYRNYNRNHQYTAPEQPPQAPQPEQPVPAANTHTNCKNFREKDISAEEKKNRLLCFFNSKRRG